MPEPEEVALILGTAREILTGPEPQQLVEEMAEPEMLPLVSEPGGVGEALLHLQGSLLVHTALRDLLVARRGAGLRVVLPPPGRRAAPVRREATSAVVEGIITAGADAREVLLCTPTNSMVVPIEALEVEPAPGFDPGLGLVSVRGRVEEWTGDALSWAAVMAVSSRGLACELLGVAEHALALAIRHVLDRHQFGRPLGAFQTVRHRLADVKVQVEAARAVAEGTAHRSDDLLSATCVKALAGRAALAATAAAQQVCGGMGFTWEHGLHVAVRRAYSLDSLLGSSETLDEEVGRLLEDRTDAPALAVPFSESDQTQPSAARRTDSPPSTTSSAPVT